MNKGIHEDLAFLSIEPVSLKVLPQTRRIWGYAIYVMSTQVTLPALKVLFSRHQIAERVAEIGKQIDRDYAGQSVVLLGVLKGAAIFLADLARNITIDCTFDFVAVSSYGKGQKTSGAVKLIKDVDQPIEGKHVIVVEDILDTGLTLDFLQKLFRQHQPRSLRIAALLDKPSRRLVKIEADYVGFKIPNQFVLGYGMDYAERFRNMPDICLMPPDYPE
jgi:hypoxanthine phosphoribosyltransferase